MREEAALSLVKMTEENQRFLPSFLRFSGLIFGSPAESNKLGCAFLTEITEKIKKCQKNLNFLLKIAQKSSIMTFGAFAVAFLTEKQRVKFTKFPQI